jgi:hypothetical protein
MFFGTKAQIQMGETIFIVIFIILIIVFGLVFFSQAEGESMRDKQQEFQELDSIVATQYVASLNELKCSSYGAADPSCFDKIKVQSFSNLTRNDWDLVGEYYVDQLGPANIRIEEIYPNPQNWTVYNYTGTFENGDVSYGGRQTQIPIALLNPVTKERAFGVLYLTIFNRVI